MNTTICHAHDTVPAGTFYGEDTVPAGTFHHDDADSAVKGKA